MLRFLLFLYKKIWLKPSCCRFSPSCSVYAVEAVERHGLFYGCFLALKRLIRCNPFCEGGFDPVP